MIFTLRTVLYIAGLQNTTKYWHVIDDVNDYWYTVTVFILQCVMDFGKTCHREVANLLRTCYGETGVIDFGLNTAHRFTNKRTANVIQQ